jgi:hypothetical protein
MRLAFVLYRYLPFGRLQREVWSERGVEYGRTQDLYRMPELAAHMIPGFGVGR